MAATLGFLWFNRPRRRSSWATWARLAWPDPFVAAAPAWNTTGISGPLAALVLAAPLLEVLVTSISRMRRGRSPFMGDGLHPSLRMLRRGCRPGVVIALYAAVAALTGHAGRHRQLTHRLMSTPLRIDFIVGMSRTGITWLTRALNLHPELTTFGQSRFWGKHFREPTDPRGYGAAELRRIHQRLRGFTWDGTVGHGPGCLEQGLEDMRGSSTRHGLS